MRVGWVAVYPLKSSRGIAVDAAEVARSGLVDDRRWAVVDTGGTVVTARENDRLLRVTATSEPGGLVLDARGSAFLRVPTPASGPAIEVSVSRMPRAVDAGDSAAAWLSQILRQTVRLVWQDEVRHRTVSAQHGGLEGDHLNLADAGPVLLTSTASLDRLNGWIAERDVAATVAMERFRPNIVVEDGLDAFEEDDWLRVRIGDVEYRHGEICDRCVLTTIDPDTLAHGPEPIRTLARHRRWGGKTWFGVRLIPLGTGTVRIGDRVTVLDRRSSSEVVGEAPCEGVFHPGDVAQRW